MVELILVRHAIAAERDPERWPDDRERPLTKRGKQRFEQVAAGLGRLVPEVDLLLSSPLRRAWQTAAILEEMLGWPETLACPPLQPDADPAQLIPALEPLIGTHAQRLALVGHEPHLPLLASHLLAGPSAEVCLPFKKGGVAVVAFTDAFQAGHACLRWMATPKMLRALAR